MIHADRRQTIAATIACGLIVAVAVALWRDRPGAHDGALRFAVVQGDLAKAAKLLRRGANPNGTADQPVLVLETALLFAPKNREEMVALLLKHGADPNAVLHGDSVLTQGMFIRRISPGMLSLFAENGADFNRKDNQGNTFLHKALRYPYADPRLIPILLANGADPDVPDSQGEASLRKAVDMHAPQAAEVVKLLIAHGADVNGKDSKGHISLCRSLAASEDVILALVEGGSDLTALDDLGETPLLMAVRWHKFKAARAMIEKGADIHAENKGGTTALFGAASEGDLGLVKILVENGARVGHANSGGYTPLHSAAAGYRQEVAAYLIGKGAKINRKTSKGLTPLAYA
ncbi:MAG: hypothetical protein HN380_31980, partial [Victivallales bacterium]|nr:hypothetical protein [Victivallales bacterium]